MLSQAFVFNEKQRFTAHLGLQTELEDAFEQNFPMLINAEVGHRELLTIVYQAMVAGTPLSVEGLYEVARKDLRYSNNTIEARLKNLKRGGIVKDGLIQCQRNAVDGRKRDVLLCDEAWHKMQLVGEHIAASILHYAALIEARGKVPTRPTNSDFFDPIPSGAVS